MYKGSINISVKDYLEEHHNWKCNFNYRKVRGTPR